MAYAALISLTNTIEQNLHHHLIPDKQQIETLLQEATFLQNFLENSLQNDYKEVERLESQIIDAAYRAADIVESHLVDGATGFLHKDNISKMNFILRMKKASRSRSRSPKPLAEIFTTFSQALEKVIEEIHSIKQEVMKVKDEIGVQDPQPRPSLGAVSSKPGLSGESTLVGHDDEVMEIRTRLTTGSSKLQVLSILGMGGIGKTTMAKNIYDHLSIKDHFDISGWVSVSQEYNERKIILAILDSMKKLPDMFGESSDMFGESSDKLKLLLHKNLSGMRYFIVLDDVWDKEAWDNVKRLFSNENNGSRILLTTRLKEVADHANSCRPLHQVRFLDDVESWKLFHYTVFGREGCCQSVLEEIGKKISQNCRGLPLSIVVIGGLLSKSDKTEHYWRNVLENMSLTITSNDEQCLKVLSLSYKCLPHHLRGCLLYMGIFPEDSDISVFQLVSLWVAEGILKPIRSKSLEDVAEEYLLDLVERNLILGGKRNSIGKIKTCKIHDLLRDLCVRQSEKEMFFRPTYLRLLDMSKGSRRIIVHPDKIKLDHEVQTRSSLLPRSFYFFLRTNLPKKISVSNFRLVRVFYASCYSNCVPFGREQLVSLRYLYIRTFDNFEVLEYVYTLRHLQTLIIKFVQPGCRMNSKIWEMQELRHVVIKSLFLLDPPDSEENGTENSIIVLKNLLTLTTIENFRCTEEVLKRIPNLEKLGIFYGYHLEDIEYYCLNNLVRLNKLEELQLRFPLKEKSSLKNLTFPPSLKKLTLIDGCRPWEEMKIVGLLPNLQVLKLKEKPFDGPEWELDKGGFLQLKVLLFDKVDLEKWVAESIHFPELQRLVIKNCKDLKIPSSIGDIPTLQSIEVSDCGTSVITSAKQIEEEQEGYGGLRVLIVGEYQ